MGCTLRQPEQHSETGVQLLGHVSFFGPDFVAVVTEFEGPYGLYLHAEGDPLLKGNRRDAQGLGEGFRASQHLASFLVPGILSGWRERARRERFCQ